MGQSSSRYRDSPLPLAPPTRSTPPNAVAGASTDLSPDSSSDVVPDTPTHPRSRRSSFRKTMLKLVKPSRRINSDSGDVRRSWRNSRRWSVAPSSSTPTLAEPPPTSSSDVSTAGPSTLDPRPADKGKQREISLPEEEELSNDATLDQASPQPANPTNPHADTLPSVVEPSHAAAETDSEPLLVDNSPVEDNGSDLPSEVTLPVQGNEPSPLPGAQPPSPQPRHFPPPGTLVVVQGIVHTTDVSRATSPPPDNNASNSNARPASGLAAGSEQTRTRSRNRLSALLRPRSTSSRPSSTVITDPTTIPSPPELESPPLSGSESSSEASTQTDVTTPVVNENVDSPQQDQLADTPPPATENRVPSISSSSIDVLGTLLSVAAAATAASLLTGSSEPILSSGLAPPNPGASSPPGSPLPTSSPSSASLPNLPAYHRPPSPNTGVPDISAAGRAERMRQAWGTIRERLGLRPSAPPPADHAMGNLDHGNPGGDTDSPSVVNGESLASATPDTRELMLAEMARAFNIGLGLNGLGGMAPAAPDATGAAEQDAAEGSTEVTGGAAATPEGDPLPHSQSHPSPPPGVTMPPEGSFERFLIDLQIDLRAALTQAEDGPLPERHRQPFQQPESQRVERSGSPVLNVEHPIADALVASPSTNSTSPQPLQSEIPNSDPQGRASSSDDSSYVDMPALSYVSDSDSELDEEEHDGEEYDDDDDFHSAEHGPPGESLHGQTRTTLPGTGRIDASGRINWWRLYRFPPIVSPRTDTAGPSPTGLGPISPLNTGASLPNPHTPDSTISTASNSTPTTPASSSTMEQTPQPTPANVPTPAHAPDPSPSRLPLNSVVPVIVVGLQSVNSEWRHDIPSPGQNEGVAFWGGNGPENPTGENGGDDDDLDGWGGQHPVGSGANPSPDEGRGRGRAQGWQSRAANAIRNLRPGRRTADAGTGAQAPIIAPGSRTFLIYVIGGYYPPDHSIVTGGSNILDSFEALLELADLLGQVKPPTATKEDIDKSGLAIIKASELPQHEKDGKVSSNCLDRCLICLDDYADDDDVRVMTCRHAFHKGCVDEWLQRGRNNCPACRSTGVSNDPQPMPTA